jgi:hypothetical protein
MTKLLSQYHCELVDIDKNVYLDLILCGDECDLNNTVFKNGVSGCIRIY